MKNIIFLLQSISNILNDYNLKYIDSKINNIADNFVDLSNLLDYNGILIKSKDEFANNLVYIIENYNIIGNEMLENLRKMHKTFDKFYDEVVNKIRIKVIIYGNNNVSHEAKKFIHEYIKLYECNNINEILNYNFDFIVVCGDNSNTIIGKILDFGIEKDKVINFMEYLNGYFEVYKTLYNKNYFRSLLYSHIMKVKQNRDIKVLATGLSYSLHGISTETFNDKCIKLTLPSQDLYYDYLILDNVLSDNTNNIKYCILGMSYYSFEFDLSFSSESYRILDTYYPILKDSHHLQIPKNYITDLGIENIDEGTKDEIDIIFSRKIYRYIIENIFKVDMTPEYDEYYWNKRGLLEGKSFEDFSEESRMIEAEKRAKSHSKDYSKTRIENESIITNIFDLLNRNEIKPVVVIFPTTKYYYSKFDSTVKLRFYSIMSRLKKQYQFEFVDMFQSQEFDLQDFLDWDHLNKKGAEKMSRILYEKVIK